MALPFCIPVSSLNVWISTFICEMSRHAITCNIKNIAFKVFLESIFFNLSILCYNYKITWIHFLSVLSNSNGLTSRKDSNTMLSEMPSSPSSANLKDFPLEKVFL